MPVHIFGETGTGKELMARHVHYVSRRTGPFIALNCGAVPDGLFIAELFGYERGAFTNARNDGAPGLLRQADGGTLFLDEVADIPLVAQTALLRFLDAGEVRPVGGCPAGCVDVQIVSATNRPLAELVVLRQFRQDLLHRINAFTIELPPLRSRTDFAQIVRRLVVDLAPEAAITNAAIDKLAGLPWPGNIRELRHTLQRALLRRHMAYIDEESFDDALAGQDQRACPDCRASPLDRRRCEEIDATHRFFEGNVALTARKLGLSRTTVYKHLVR
jgi:transcriptional regulator of acetoin/glycerol metabolism